jgi:hypothetical protein
VSQHEEVPTFPALSPGNDVHGLAGDTKDRDPAGRAEAGLGQRAVQLGGRVHLRAGAEVDEQTGVRGLPQQLAARAGPAAVRLAALVFLLLASGLLVLAAQGAHRWVALAALAAAAVLATVGARGAGRLPFVAAFGIAAINVVLLAAGGIALT